MTPSELADRLHNRWEIGARASTEELDYVAAAMLREAERLLQMAVPAVVAWSNQYDLDEDGREQWAEIAGQIDTWLEGRTP